mmetsp:Transcript_4493/g.11599  ORF Transcript_4493/g.11599 Transcript_4493/m.11599 type:complete len:129 (-) Transcript_4493:1675-2061(-)
MEQNRTLAALSALRLRCDGGAMTLAKLKLICKEVGEPQCPAACTRLELQCQLLAEVPADIALHYTELRYLRLDRNQIQRIERLEGLAALDVLNLQVRYVVAPIVHVWAVLRNAHAASSGHSPLCRRTR